VRPSQKAAEPVRFGKYLLVDRLGSGGMAEVWRAKIVGPAGFERTVVLKRILPHKGGDAHLVQMFEREARLSARLNHSNIVHVYELGDVDGEYFLAMEYVRGHDVVEVLRAHLNRFRRVPPVGLGASVVRDVCRALAYAHALTDDEGRPLRIIHRDVSPSNIMLAFDGAVKLVDFGIAKALNDAADHYTQTGTIKGKFGYMPPEQVNGEEIDHRADLYAAGVVLHELLTGKRLFRGETEVQTIDLVRKGEVRPPSASNPEVPPELDRICLRALARERDARYPTGDDMAYELDRVVHALEWGAERTASLLKTLFPDEPTDPDATASPADASPRPRAQKRARRRSWLALPLIVGVGGGLWLARSAPERPRVVTVAPAAPVAPPPPVLPASVMVRVNSTPAGAAVFLDEESAPRGETPLQLTLPRGRARHTLHLKKKSYQDNLVEVTPDSDSRVEVTLTPAWAAPFAPRPRPGAQ
jgi:serine/threonine protein kinase